jgi:sialidase-1
MIEKQDLFEARQDGYWNYRIPCIAVTKRNVVLVATEARPGNGGDYDFIDVLMRRSTDGGKTFAPAVKLVDHITYGNGPVNNFVMIPDQMTGRVIALFCHDYARVFTMHSDDDGASFSKPVEITTVFECFRAEYPWQVCATGPGHGLQLRNGRMIIPVWLSDAGGSGQGAHRAHRPSIVTLIYSDDHGDSWQRGSIVCRHDDVANGGTIVNPSETIAVELSDGSVMFNIRSESTIHRRLVAISPDGVSGWQIRGFDDALQDPVCMASILHHEWATGDHSGRILFANPDPLNLTPAPCVDRRRLTVKMSLDDGTTWPLNKVLEEGPAGYSDLACLPDGTVLCFYECGALTHMCDTRFLRLARFDKKFIQER